MRDGSISFLWEEPANEEWACMIMLQQGCNARAAFWMGVGVVIEIAVISGLPRLTESDRTDWAA